MSELTVSVMPEIIEMRKEWKKKYGDTRVFDYLYMGLRDKIVSHNIQSMKEWKKLDKEIEKAEKNTWLFVEEKAQ